MRFLFSCRLLGVLFVLYLLPGSIQAQVDNILLGTWEGTYSDQHTTGAATGKCRLVLNRMDGDIVEGILETYDLTNGRKAAKSGFRAKPEYLDGRFYLMQQFESKYYNSNTACMGTYRWELSGGADNRRHLSGSFHSQDPTCGPGLALFQLQSKDDKSSAPWNIAGINTDNVDLIDATEVSDFQQGYAIIRKGENFAMIDQSGSEVIPYGKYKFNIHQKYGIDFDKCGFNNGMCVVRDPVTEMYGYINLKADLVVPCTLKDAEPFMKDGYGLALEEDKTGADVRFYYNIKGEKFEVKKPWSIYLNRYENFYRVPAVSGITAFYTKEGKLLFKTSRKTRDSFGDGMIGVDTTLKMSGDKIGFLDSLGKVAIPYIFKSGRGISAFSEGLALYQPAVKDEFSYVFIDKKGNHVIRVRSTEEYPDIYFNNGQFSKAVLFSNGFVWGMSKGKDFIMDKNGAIHFITDMIEASNTLYTTKFKKFKSEFEYRNRNVRPDMVIFQAGVNIDVPEKVITTGFGGVKEITGTKNLYFKGIGLSDLSGKMLLPPIYSRVGFFDQVSGLARATIMDKGRNKTLVDGYVNNTGAFVLILTTRED